MKETTSKNQTIGPVKEPFFRKGAENKSSLSGSLGSSKFFSANSVQASLAIGEPNDPYEKEAETVAKQVMQQYDVVAGGASEVSSQAIQTLLMQPILSRRISRRMQLRLQSAFGLLQSKCAECEQEEEEMHLKTKVQRSNDSGGVVSNTIERQINHSKGRGKQLDAGTKALMEASFGSDFGAVRIHTDSQAVQMSQDLGAHAFTVGRDIYFNEGTYQPQTKEGIGLLSHELTHVVQQGAAVQTKRKPSAFQGGSFSNPAFDSTMSSAMQQSTLFRKVIEGFQKSASRDNMVQKHELTGSKGADTIQMMDHSKKLRRCGGCVGGGCDAPAPTPAPACAKPINWKHDNPRNLGTEKIRVDLSWESSTGNLADLSNCTIREVVNYGSIPNPPFTWNPPNPTILSVPGANGAAMDTHSYPPGIGALGKVAGTMTASQVYQWKCTGAGCDSKWHDFPSQNYTISREVAGSGANWTYTITKTGGSGFSFSRAVPIP